MGWTLHRWTWVLEGPLFVGFTPSGSLNRCRIYVPARAVWGAVTAEAARHTAEGMPDYKGVGDRLKSDARFSYLYPAERFSNRWVAWLPRYERDHGLCWRREDDRDDPQPDRRFRRRLLTTRPGTAIDPSSDSAADGSLRETECVSDRWRQSRNGDDNRVAYVGYVFAQTDAAKDYTGEANRLFLGGDTRYGLGWVQRVALEESQQVFGLPTERAAKNPRVQAKRVLAHAEADQMQGNLERTVGWSYRDHGGIGSPGQPLWVPGSHGSRSAAWDVRDTGFWHVPAERT